MSRIICLRGKKALDCLIGLEEKRRKERERGKSCFIISKRSILICKQGQLKLYAYEPANQRTSSRVIRKERKSV